MSTTTSRATVTHVPEKPPRMTASGLAFWYAPLDSAGFVTLDKPRHVRGHGVGSKVEVAERLFVGGGVTLYDCRP